MTDLDAIDKLCARADEISGKFKFSTESFSLGIKLRTLIPQLVKELRASRSVVELALSARDKTTYTQPMGENFAHYPGLTMIELFKACDAYDATVKGYEEGK